ncbi:MAG: protein-tyrosine phosphatase [Psychromonas sp.]|jgi:protein-tyrosine phosphatase|uniref:phosphatase domain-containing putative toxin n=1 Tax=Psychromonas sp. TaxID=1884585 RepID=UPI0039E621A8
MSLTHPIFPISIENSSAQIILTPCPATKEVDLKTSLTQLKQAGAEALLTLMTQDELDKNQLSTIGESVQAVGMTWYHLPIIDDHMPEHAFMEAWENAGPAVQALLEQGKSIALHCKGGSGRTGLVAAQILLQRGEAIGPVMARIQAVRPNAFTQTCQRDYLINLKAL